MGGETCTLVFAVFIFGTQAQNINRRSKFNPTVCSEPGNIDVLNTGSCNSGFPFPDSRLNSITSDRLSKIGSPFSKPFTSIETCAPKCNSVSDSLSTTTLANPFANRFTPSSCETVTEAIASTPCNTLIDYVTTRPATSFFNRKNLDSCEKSSCSRNDAVSANSIQTRLFPTSYQFPEPVTPCENPVNYNRPQITCDVNPGPCSTISEKPCGSNIETSFNRLANRPVNSLPCVDIGSTNCNNLLNKPIFEAFPVNNLPSAKTICNSVGDIPRCGVSLESFNSRPSNRIFEAFPSINSVNSACNKPVCDIQNIPNFNIPRIQSCNNVPQCNTFTQGLGCSSVETTQTPCNQAPNIITTTTIIDNGISSTLANALQLLLLNNLIQNTQNLQCGACSSCNDILAAGPCVLDNVQNFGCQDVCCQDVCADVNSCNDFNDYGYQCCPDYGFAGCPEFDVVNSILNCRGKPFPEMLTTLFGCQFLPQLGLGCEGLPEVVTPQCQCAPECVQPCDQPCIQPCVQPCIQPCAQPYGNFDNYGCNLPLPDIQNYADNLLQGYCGCQFLPQLGLGCQGLPEVVTPQCQCVPESVQPCVQPYENFDNYGYNLPLPDIQNYADSLLQGYCGQNIPFNIPGLPTGPSCFSDCNNLPLQNVPYLPNNCNLLPQTGCTNSPSVPCIPNQFCLPPGYFDANILAPNNCPCLPDELLLASLGPCGCNNFPLVNSPCLPNGIDMPPTEYFGCNNYPCLLDQFSLTPQGCYDCNVPIIPNDLSFLPLNYPSCNNIPQAYPCFVKESPLVQTGLPDCCDLPQINVPNCQSELRTPSNNCGSLGYLSTPNFPGVSINSVNIPNCNSKASSQISNFENSPYVPIDALQCYQGSCDSFSVNTYAPCGIPAYPGNSPFGVTLLPGACECYSGQPELQPQECFAGPPEVQCLPQWPCSFCGTQETQSQVSYDCAQPCTANFNTEICNQGCGYKENFINPNQGYEQQYVPLQIYIQQPVCNEIPNCFIEKVSPSCVNSEIAPITLNLELSCEQSRCAPEVPPTCSNCISIPSFPSVNFNCYYDCAPELSPPDVCKSSPYQAEIFVPTEIPAQLVIDPESLPNAYLSIDPSSCFRC